MFHKLIYLLGLVTFISSFLWIFLMTIRAIGIHFGWIDKCEY